MSLIPPSTLGVPTPTLTATAGTAGTATAGTAAKPTATAGTAGTATPAATAGTATTAAGGLSDHCRQVLTQIMNMLRSLMASMTGSASLTGVPCPPGTIAPAKAPAPAPAAAQLATAGTGVSPAQIRTATPTPAPVTAAPVSFFTPIATSVPTVAAPAPLPIAAPVAAAPTPLAAPVQKIPLTDGNELQQRIQNFNKTSPGNTAGLVQFLNASYSNTAFTARPDGNLAYTVGTSNFLINATGLTPRVQV
jgi:hypothetical protein